MDAKCKDCQGPIYESEKDYEKWQKFVAEKPEMNLPKRCKNCRLIKKQQNQEQR